MQTYTAHGSARLKRRHTTTNSSKGFSLIETLTTTAILAIVAGAAIPDLSKLLATNRVNAVASDLSTSLSAARSYAITKHTLVQVCALDPNDNSKCNKKRDYNANWSNGWLIFSDLNRNNDLDDGDTVLQLLRTNSKINIVFNQRGRLRFFPDGSARSAGFYLCDKAKTHFKHILLLHTGRARNKTNLKPRQQQICSSASET